MKRVVYSALILAMFGLGNAGILIPTAFAAVTVTPATGGTNISADKAANAISPQFTTLGNIVITSNANNDFAKNQTNATFILTAPSGWTFNPGAGSGSVTGTAITFNSISVTSSAVTVTYSRTNNNSSNAALTISGIQVRAANGGSLPSSGNILRTSASPGTATITGITNNTTNFGSLSQIAGAVSASQSTVSASPTSLSTDGGAQTTITVTAKDQFGNLLSGKSVVLSSTGTGNTLTQPSATTNASGQSTGALSSTKAEAKTISATISGTAVTQTAAATFTVGTVDHITITPSGSQSVAGGSTLAFSAQGYDLNNNPVSGLTFTWAVVAGTGSGTVSSGGVLTGNKAGTLTITATSGAKTGTSGTVTVTNITPTVANQSVSTNEDTALPIVLSGADANGDALTYIVVSGPTHGSLSGLNPSTGAATYTPSGNYNGADAVTFKANDGIADSTAGTISITVNPVNDLPVLAGVGNKSVNENQAFFFTISATDPDSNILTYSASNLPPGAVFNASTQTFSWTPTYDQAGTYSNIHFSVTDGSLSASEDISITVSNVDRPPTLTTIGNKTTDENQPLSFAISGSDPDSDTVTYSASNLPSGASFNASTQTFSWTPGFDQSGNYNVVFTASDGTLSDSENVAIDVGNINRTPNLNAISNKSVAEGTVLNFSVSATDPDSDPLTYAASNLPTGAAFNASTQTFSWTPTYDQAGTYSNIHFSVTDGNLTDFENITITVSNINRAPILGSIGDKTVNENQNLNFALSASDPDGNAVSYSASDLPAGAAVDSATGIFSWTPDYSQSGIYTPTLSVCDNDPSSLCAQETITITVNNVNRVPVLNSIGNKTADENSLLQFAVSASDPDSDALTYSAANLPAGASFDTNTKIFSWTPTYSQSGTYSNVHFQVTDGSLSASEDVVIIIANIDRTPILDSIGNKTINENQSFSFVISATDPDNDPLTYSASNLPTGASFNASTQTFAWTPTYDQAGTYDNVRFEATDGSATTSEDIAIAVNNINRAPALDAIGNKTGAENSAIGFTVSATDPDSDQLTYAASNLPIGATFNAATKTFSWTPDYGQAGTYSNIHFSVTDGSLSVGEDIAITISHTNRPPVLAAIGGKSTDENQTLSFTVSGSDPDSDTVTYSASNLPRGAAFDAGTGTFSWKPNFNQSGNYPDIHFQVSDGRLTAGEDITITVKDVNQDGGGMTGGGGGSLLSYNFGPSLSEPTLANSSPIVGSAENISTAVVQPAPQQELNNPVAFNAANQNPVTGNQGLLASASQAAASSEGQNTANSSGTGAPQGNTSLFADVSALMSPQNIVSAVKSAVKTIYASFDYLRNFFMSFFSAR